MSTIPAWKKSRSPAKPQRLTNQCPECGNDELTIEDTAHEVVCSGCDTVLGQPIRRNRAAVYSPGDESKLRTGGTVDLSEARNGIGTSQFPKDLVCLSYNPHEDSRTKRLKKELSDIEHYGNILELQSYEIDTAQLLYQQAKAEGLLTGSSVEGFIAACLLAGAQQSDRHVPIRQEVLTNQTAAKKSQFKSAKQDLAKELDVAFEPLKTTDMLVQANERLNLPVRVRRFTRKLCKRCRNRIVNLPPSPKTRAAVLLTVAYDELNVSESPTQGEIADALNISDTTLSTKKRQFLDSEEISVPEIRGEFNE